MSDADAPHPSSPPAPAARAQAEAIAIFGLWIVAIIVAFLQLPQVHPLFPIGVSCVFVALFVASELRAARPARDSEALLHAAEHAYLFGYLFTLLALLGTAIFRYDELGTSPAAVVQLGGIKLTTSVAGLMAMLVLRTVALGWERSRVRTQHSREDDLADRLAALTDRAESTTAALGRLQDRASDAAEGSLAGLAAATDTSAAALAALGSRSDGFVQTLASAAASLQDVRANIPHDDLRRLGESARGLEEAVSAGNLANIFADLARQTFAFNSQLDATSKSAMTMRKALDSVDRKALTAVTAGAEDVARGVAANAESLAAVSSGAGALVDRFAALAAGLARTGEAIPAAALVRLGESADAAAARLAAIEPPPALADLQTSLRAAAVSAGEADGRLQGFGDTLAGLNENMSKSDLKALGQALRRCAERLDALAPGESVSAFADTLTVAVRSAGGFRDAAVSADLSASEFRTTADAAGRAVADLRAAAASADPAPLVALAGAAREAALALGRHGTAADAGADQTTRAAQAASDAARDAAATLAAAAQSAAACLAVAAPPPALPTYVPPPPPPRSPEPPADNASAPPRRSIVARLFGHR